MAVMELLSSPDTGKVSFLAHERVMSRHILVQPPLLKTPEAKFLQLTVYKELEILVAQASWRPEPMRIYCKPEWWVK